MSLLYLSVAQAQIIGTLPYSFSNGTIIDAGQMNADFGYVVSQVNARAVSIGSNSSITSILGLTTPLSAGQGGSVVYTASTSAGSGNAQVVATATPSGFALVGRPTIIFTAGFTNTSATQFNINSTGLVNVLKQTQAGLVALTANDIIAGSLVIATYDGSQYELVSYVPPPPVVVVTYALPGALAFTQANDDVSPTTTVNLNASRVLVANTTGIVKEFISPAQCAINVTTTNLYGGLDTGSVAPSTWYYTYYVSDGSTLGCFASTSSTAPSVTSGYYYVRVGAIRTNGASQLTAISQMGNVVTYTTQPSITANASPQAIAPFFPPTAKEFTVNVSSYNGTFASSGSVEDGAGHVCGATYAAANATAVMNAVCPVLNTNFSAIATTSTSTFVAYGWHENAPVN